ncbi:hypothetical protein AB0E08_35465 [Streptomyces sp. NPDC048281]|uniref:hypothetical protein n=1 Tax=Streptomyces sp. NPDC048281 TaxID=3154715 RepID=UPI003442C908
MKVQRRGTGEAEELRCLESHLLAAQAHHEVSQADRALVGAVQGRFFQAGVRGQDLQQVAFGGFGAQVFGSVGQADEGRVSQRPGCVFH